MNDFWTYNNTTQDFWKDATKDFDKAMFQKFLQFCWANKLAPSPKSAKAFFLANKK